MLAHARTMRCNAWQKGPAKIMEDMPHPAAVTSTSSSRVRPKEYEGIALFSHPLLLTPAAKTSVCLSLLRPLIAVQSQNKPHFGDPQLQDSTPCSILTGRMIVAGTEATHCFRAGKLVRAALWQHAQGMFLPILPSPFPPFQSRDQGDLQRCPCVGCTPSSPARCCEIYEGEQSIACAGKIVLIACDEIAENFFRRPAPG